MARASLARGLSSDVNFSVSAGSISFRRKLSSVIRKGLESLRAFFVKSLISLLFTKFHLSAILVFFNVLSFLNDLSCTASDQLDLARHACRMTNWASLTRTVVSA